MSVRWRAVPARASFTEGAWLRLPRPHPEVGIGRWAPGGATRRPSCHRDRVTSTNSVRVASRLRTVVRAGWSLSSPTGMHSWTSRASSGRSAWARATAIFSMTGGGNRECTKPRRSPVRPPRELHRPSRGVAESFQYLTGGLLERGTVTFGQQSPADHRCPRLSPPLPTMLVRQAAVRRHGFLPPSPGWAGRRRR